MISRIHRGKARPATALLAMLALFGSSLAPGAAAYAQASDDLKLAQNLFEETKFDQALAILSRIIEGRDDSAPHRLRDATILQARCRVGLGDLLMAEDTFCEVLALDPNWRPDPNEFFSSLEVVTFESALIACPPPAAVDPSSVLKPATETAKPWYMKPVVWAGAAAAVVLAVVLLSGGDDDPEPGSLPDPPQPPPPPKSR